MNNQLPPFSWFYFIVLSVLSMNVCFASPHQITSNESHANLPIKHLMSVNTIQFDSKSLGRVQATSIYLPSSYPHSQKRYPVIYVMDADFLMTTTINTVNIRSQRGLMPEAIVVGFSTPDYQSRLSIGMPMKRQPQDKDVIFADGKPEAFLQFVEQEVMPYMEQHYPVANHSTLIGMSPTVGVILTDYFNNTPLFNGYIALAADMNMLNAEGVPLTDKVLERSLGSTAPPLYISVGALDFANNPSLKTAMADLQKKSIMLKPKTKVKAQIINDGEHYGMSLVGINNGFNHVFPSDEWQADYLTIRQHASPVTSLKHHYQSLSERFGIPTYPVVDGYWMGFSIAGTNRYLLREKQYKKAIDLLQWAIKNHPNSAALHYNLAGAYRLEGQQQAAIKAITKAIQLAREQRDASLSDYQAYLAKLTTD